MALPPDLRVLCRRLTSTAPAQLPQAVPTLINHVLKCGHPLSLPHDQKAKETSSETAQLVLKFKTRITSLLNGKDPSGRFAAVALAKAVIDVGGWECLRSSDPWVRGMISIIQASLNAILCGQFNTLT
jgi:pre-rRNA-processing protein RIX1